MNMADPPTGVLAGHAEHQIADHLALGAGSAWASVGSAVVLPGHQHAVPLEQRVRREQTAELAQQIPSELRPRGGQTPFLGSVQDDSLAAEFLPQNAVLLHEVLNSFLLLPVHPAGKGHHDESPWIPKHGRILTAQASGAKR